MSPCQYCAAPVTCSVPWQSTMPVEPLVGRFPAIPRWLSTAALLRKQLPPPPFRALRLPVTEHATPSSDHSVPSPPISRSVPLAMGMVPLAASPTTMEWRPQADPGFPPDATIWKLSTVASPPWCTKVELVIVRPAVSVPGVTPPAEPAHTDPVTKFELPPMPPCTSSTGNGCGPVGFEVSYAPLFPASFTWPEDGRGGFCEKSRKSSACPTWSMAL